MNQWWRAYEDVVDHPKLLLLSSDTYRWGWFCLCCLASAYGGVLPPVEVISLKLRKPKQKVDDLIRVLIKARLIDVRPDGRLEPHNWDSRQFRSDNADPTNAVRQQRYRDRHRNGESNVTRNGESNVTHNVTRNTPSPLRDRYRNAPQNTETETETETDKEKESSLRSPKKTARGARLTHDWQPGPEDLAFAKDHGFTNDGEIAVIVAEFRDYWIAVPGQRGCKLDWPATFRNRVRELETRKGKSHGRQHVSDLAFQLADEIRDAERAAGIERPARSVRGS